MKTDTPIDGLTLGPLVKVRLKPPAYFWTINDTAVEVSLKELTNQKLFQERIIEKLNIWPPTIKPTAWRELINLTLANATTLRALS